MKRYFGNSHRLKTHARCWTHVIVFAVELVTDPQSDGAIPLRLQRRLAVLHARPRSSARATSETSRRSCRRASPSSRSSSPRASRGDGPPRGRAHAGCAAAVALQGVGLPNLVTQSVGLPPCSTRTAPPRRCSARTRPWRSTTRCASSPRRRVLPVLEDRHRSRHRVPRRSHRRHARLHRGSTTRKACCWIAWACTTSCVLHGGEPQAAGAPRRRWRRHAQIGFRPRARGGRSPGGPRCGRCARDARRRQTRLAPAIIAGGKPDTRRSVASMCAGSGGAAAAAAAATTTPEHAERMVLSARGQRVVHQLAA